MAGNVSHLRRLDPTMELMHNDVTDCVILISNKIEYLEKYGSYKNSIKEVILCFVTDLSNAIKNLRVKISFHKYSKNFGYIYT